MTIKELIEKLKEFPENFEVQIQNGDNGGDYYGSREIVGLYNHEDKKLILY